MDEEFMKMASGAAAMFQLFQSLVAAGFTEDQALKLIATTLAMTLVAEGLDG